MNDYQDFQTFDKETIQLLITKVGNFIVPIESLL